MITNPVMGHKNQGGNPADRTESPPGPHREQHEGPLARGTLNPYTLMGMMTQR